MSALPAARTPVGMTGTATRPFEVTDACGRDRSTATAVPGADGAESSGGAALPSAAPAESMAVALWASSRRLMSDIERNLPLKGPAASIARSC